MAAKPITTLLADFSQEILDPAVPPMIEVRNVCMDFNTANQQLNSLKEYFIAAARRELVFKRFRALDDISLTVQKGDVFGILGTNGSGKSTLMKVVSGVLDPTEGEVFIHGNIAPLIELGAGFDFELTARENIYLNGALLGYPKDFINQHFEEIVDFAEIREFLDMPLKNYSSGMVSRIAFAIATVIIPEILVVDEVLSVGDFMFQQKCEKRIQNLIQEHGTTVLIVSHSSKQIERLCNKAVWIEKGHMRMVGPARDVSQVYQALGGHTGSADAERKLFAVMANSTSPNLEAIETIAGKDHYATGVVAAAKLQASDKRSTVVLGPGENLRAFFPALGLAGILGAHNLMTHPENLPESILTTLANIAPAKVVYLRPNNAKEQVMSSLRAAVPRDCEIQVIPFENADQLSLAALELMEEAGILSEVALLSTGSTGAAMAALAPAATGGIPCLVATSTKSVERLLEKIRTTPVKHLVVLGDTENSTTQAIVAQIKNAGLSVTALADSRDDASNEAALRWMQEQDLTNDAPTSLYLASQEGTVDALSSAALISSDNGQLLSINHNDMESLVRAAEFIADNRDSIERIVVLGSDVCFNDVDKSIFGKALAGALVE